MSITGLPTEGAFFTATAYDTEEEWLDAKLVVLGASEAAGALGYSKWKSPYSIWADKTQPPQPSEVNWKLFKAHWTERALVEWYSRVTGQRAAHSERVLCVSTRWPWMACTPDAFILPDGHDRGWGVLECKDVGWRMREDWNEEEAEAPMYYSIQVQHALAVLGLAWGAIIASIEGRNEPLLCEEPRHERMINGMIEQERAFWRLVETRTEPPADDTESCTDAIRRVHPRETLASITLPYEALDLHRRRDELVKAAAEIDREKRGIDNQLKAWIGDAELGIGPGFEYTLKTQHRDAYMVEAKAMRVLRRAGKEES